MDNFYLCCPKCDFAYGIDEIGPNNCPNGHGGLVINNVDRMKPIIVLETHGKHESVDNATVHLFNSEEKARAFCNEKSTGRKKYWNNAEIVSAGEVVSLDPPDNETSY